MARQAEILTRRRQGGTTMGKLWRASVGLEAKVCRVVAGTSGRKRDRLMYVLMAELAACYALVALLALRAG